MAGVARPVVGESQSGQRRVCVLGALFCAGNQAYRITKHIGDHAGEQWVVRATQDQRVDAGNPQRVEVAPCAGEEFRAARDSRLDEANEPRAGDCVQLDLRSAAAKASSYAWELAVASVQITPTRPDRVAATARRAAGKITSTTGTAYRSRASRSTAALAELQAITKIFTPWSTR